MGVYFLSSIYGCPVFPVYFIEENFFLQCVLVAFVEDQLPVNV
jgi:hypothetical protein